MRPIQVLNVAEKPSVAKQITNLLAQSNHTRKHSHSKFNPVTGFSYTLNQKNCHMIFTSVAGHIIRTDFPAEYRDWNTVKPESLFYAPIAKEIDPRVIDISKNLEAYAASCQWLVLWLDCDREGEAIAFEVMKICQNINPNLDIYRAIFSAVTAQEISFACRNLKRPNKNLSDAVEARSELDLKIGASFTRMMSLRYRRKFELPSSLISFGPCQFPTLGFIVERYIEIETFIREPFWYIEVFINKTENGATTPVEFHWGRTHLFDRQTVFILFELCVISPEAIVTKVSGKKKTKKRPLPLNTIEMNKCASKYLSLTSHTCMKLAENLYNRGFISYPRTETQVFAQSIELKNFIQIHQNHNIWGEYCTQLINGKFIWPRAGSTNDQAHPPIHPVKCCTREEINNEDEWKLYQFITKHFLATCSDDAYGFESTVEIDIAGEEFHTHGLIIIETNWLDIYTYEKWLSKKIPKFQVNERCQPNSLLMKEGSTSPPSLLTEADLLEKMNQNGIGTDATMHEHIHTVEERKYAEKTPEQRFSPTKLGIGLVKGYKALSSQIGIDLSQPALRASMESDIGDVADGKKTREYVTHNHLNKISAIFSILKRQITHLDIELAKYFPPIGHSVRNDGQLQHRGLVKCGHCQSMMDLMCLQNRPNDRSNSIQNRPPNRPNNHHQQDNNLRKRYLICQGYNNGCQTILQLPNNGELSANQNCCLYCNFQALNVLNTRNRKSHFICPNCFNNTPIEERPRNQNLEIEDVGDFRCFMCHNRRCPLSSEASHFQTHI